MTGADVGIGWVDATGKTHFQDRFAYNFSRPIIDKTTNDWFALQGREQDGWTAIQFNRRLNTCDSMDVPIKSGTNVLIYAYGLVDPDGDITYHEDRRGSRMIPLQSYANPPTEDKFADLEYFEFRLNNYKALIDPKNIDLVHHLVVYECNPKAVFNDKKLPNGLCDDLVEEFIDCLDNIATTWAVGGDEIVEFPQEAGYPVGGDFDIKYYMVQMHYDNTRLMSSRRDSSGIRFYIGKELRQHDIGYLTFGTNASAIALAIPPKVDRFVVDSYCPNKISYGGQRTQDEMCSHSFTYYPRINNVYVCMTCTHPEAWQTMRNETLVNYNYGDVMQWIKSIEWTPTIAAQWQEFFNNAPRHIYYGLTENLSWEKFDMPKYKDLETESCPMVLVPNIEKLG
ncbi:unnamed protein product [Rotaria sp. Silwood1]|nr:unnamed protein product [Rotaria sp. Silwood1]